MAIPKIVNGQRDFSAGELDVTMKRADDMGVMKSGARQMSNWRILNSRAVQNRPGRSALFVEAGRIEEVLMSQGNSFFIAFGNGYLRVYNSDYTLVFNATVKGDGVTPIPWTNATVNAITYAIIGLSIYIAYTAGYPNNVPQVLTWDGRTHAGGWSLTTYAESVTSGQKRTAFYRFAAPGITLQPSATTGTVNIVFSAPVLDPGMVGTRISYCGRQMTIASYVNSTHGTATVNEQLFGTETLPFASSPVGIFDIGQEVIGSISNAKGIVTAVTAGNITVQIIPPATTFVATDVVVGPGGSLAMSGAPSSAGPGAVSLWNEEVMNGFRGYPQSVFADQGRLGFANYPQLATAIGWSTIGLYTDLWVDPLVATTSTASAILELVPGKSQVLYVIPGMQSSEFIFCDNAIYFIPITVQNPLVPGSIEFIELAAHGCYPNVQPRRTEQTVIYIKTGGISVGAVQAPGAYNRPYIVDNVSDYHSHLFKNQRPVSIAVPTQSPQFEENYIYICFADGTMAVGKYQMRGGLLETSSDGKPAVGWVPWNGVGSVTWVAAFQSSVILTSAYYGQAVIETIDDSQYLDSALLVNNLPAGFTPPMGLGPLWFVAGHTVTLMDGLRMMGTYQVDATGHIVPQNNAGENLASSTLTAGQPWTATLEPFVPDADSGKSVGQRMFKRRVSRMAAYVSNSTGFLFARLFSGPLTRTSPALGTIMNTRRVPAWNQDDNPTQPPPLREEAQRWRPLGRSYDPRVAVIKDTPGPIIVHELGLEVSI